MEKTVGQISQSQVYMLFSQYLFTTMLGFRFGPLVQDAHFAAWVPLIVGTCGGLVITYGSFRLAQRRPLQFFGNYGKDIIGRPLHYPLVFIMIFSYLFSSAYLLRELVNFIIEVFLLGTPEWAVTTIFAICISYAVRSGVGTIFRCAQGVFFISVIGIIAIPMFIGSEMNASMAHALINHFDLKGMWNASFFVLTLYGEMAFILFLFPYFAHPERTMKSLFWASVTSLLIILTNLIPALLIFGPDLTANLVYPELELIRYIRAGAFLENLDPLLIAIWLTSLFLKISLFLYVAVIALTHTFSLHDHRPLSLSMSAMMVGLTLFMVKSAPQLTHLLTHGELTFLLVTELIPLLYLIVDWGRARFKGAELPER
ncbi:UNVERIFIED_CONTAM: spore germination protein KB [Brevibacillus sp. OAP136]